VEVFSFNKLVQKKKSLPPIESSPSEVETLNAMFLPREWEEQGKKFIQFVSQEKASREKMLSESVDKVVNSDPEERANIKETNSKCKEIKMVKS
jgi:hypothetical protein